MVSCLSHSYGGMAVNGNCRANLDVALTWWDEAYGRSAWVSRARCEPFGRGLSGAAREQPTTVGVGAARTVVECYGVHEVRGR